MFKRKKMKQIAKRSLAVLLAAATIFSGLALPERADAAIDDRSVCRIYMDPDVKFICPSWSGGINSISDTKYVLIGRASDYTSTIYGSVWNYRDNILANSSSTKASQDAPAPYYNNYMPLFIRSGYYFNGWDFFDADGSFIAGVNTEVDGCDWFDYSGKDAFAPSITTFREEYKDKIIRPAWKPAGYESGRGQAISILLNQTGGSNLDPSYSISYTKVKKNLITAGRGSVSNLSENSNVNGKTSYSESVGNASAFSSGTYSALDGNGQWDSISVNKSTISLNPNGGTASLCGANTSSIINAYRLTKGSDNYSVAITPASKSGYTFTGYKVTGGSQNGKVLSASATTFSDNASVTLTAQYTKDTSITVPSVNATYDGKAHALSPQNVPSGVTVTYSVNGGTYTTTVPSLTNVGSANIAWRATGTGYTTKSGSTSITINKAANPTTASGFNGSYDGQGHSVSFSNLPSGSTVTYRMDGTYYGTMKPSPTDVGSYTIEYTITNPNYIDVSGSVAITINAKANAATVAGYSGKYDGKAHSVTTSNIPNGVKVEYSVNGGAYTTTVPSRTNVGTDTIAWRATGTGFASKTGSVTLSIGKAAINVTAAGYTGTYDGNSHTITLSGVPSGVSVNYTLDGVSKGATKPTVTNAGTYTIGYSIQNANYESVSGSAKVIINKKANPATVTGYSGTYDRKSHTISVSGVPSGSTVAYEVDGKSVSSVSPRTNAGTTVVKYTITNPNYVTKEGTVSIVINKRTDMVATGKDFTAFEDGKSYSIDTPVASGPDGGCKILYSTASDGAYSQDKPTFSKAGTYTVYWKAVDPAGNYETKTGKNTVTIIKVYDYDATTGKLSICTTTKEGLDIVYANTSAMGAKSIVVKEGADAGQIDFDKFDYLESVYIDGKNDNYSSKDGLLYSADGSELKYCPKAYQKSEVVLPYSTTKVDAGVFAGRNNVEQVLVKNPDCDITDAMGNVRVIAFKDSSVLAYCQSNGIAWDPIEEIGDNFFKNETTMISFAVPDNIKTIGKNAFSGCSSLKDINLSQIETIGIGAFKNSGLENVTIPNTVKTIDSEAFAYDQALETVEFDENSQVKTIGKDAFIGCGFHEITIPDGVESIGAGAFKNTQLGLVKIEGMNTELLWDANDVILPENSEIECYYGSKAYNFAKEYGYVMDLKVGYDKDGIDSYVRDEGNVELVKGVSVGPNLVSIKEDAFNGTPRLESIVFDKDSKLESIEEKAFAGTKLVDVTLPETTTKLGKGAFADNTALKSISLGGVTEIPDQAFKGDSSLSTVVDSTKITSIGEEAFAGTNVGDENGVFYTGDALKSIGKDAFADSTTQKLVIENPNCIFPDSKIMPNTTVIQGYTNSSADVYSQAYYNKSCEPLGKPAYVITFDTVGGIGGTSSIYAVNGKDLPTIETPSMEDYSFDGYYASTNGGGTKYFDTDGQSLLRWVGTSNQTLYASWTHETFNIAYDANCDVVEGTMDNDVVNTKSDYVLSKNAYAREGYEFTGWALTKDAKTAKYADRENVRLTAKAGETVTLYAVWKPTFYTVKYNGNGGIDANGEMLDQTLKADKKGNLRENKFKRAGYTFLGWSEDSESTVATWYDKEPVSHLTEAGKTITLYAVWAKDAVKQYTITFDANGGSLDETTAPAYEGYETRIPDLGAKRDGFVFAGWSVAKASGKIDYKTGDMISTDKDLTLYAVWKTEGDVEYTIRISTQKSDGTYDVDERIMSANIGDVVTLTENIDFVVPDGFYIDETSSVVSQTIAEDTVFDIKLNREKVSVAFDLNAGDAVMKNVPVIKGLWGQRVIINSEMPERAGYIFKGWTLSKDDATPVTEVTLAIGGTVVYAIWSKEGNGGSGIDGTPAPTYTPAPTTTPDSESELDPTPTPDGLGDKDIIDPLPSSEPAPTVVPTNTPDPKPVNTPISTGTPVSTSTPLPTGTPAPTNTPMSSSTPKPTGTPDSTPIVNPMATLDVTTVPSSTPVTVSDNSNAIGTNTNTTSTHTESNNASHTTTTIREIVLTDTTPKAEVTTVTVGKVVYKISGKTATVVKVSDKKVKSVTIRNSVKIGGKTLKVTKINKNAFKGCKKLKKVTIQAGSLKSIGKNAFKGIAKKAVIKVPKAKKKAYKKLLKKSKLDKTTKIK